MDSDKLKRVEERNRVFEADIQKIKVKNKNAVINCGLLGVISVLTGSMGGLFLIPSVLAGGLAVLAAVAIHVTGNEKIKRCKERYLLSQNLEKWQGLANTVQEIYEKDPEIKEKLDVFNQNDGMVACLAEESGYFKEINADGFADSWYRMIGVNERVTDDHPKATMVLLHEIGHIFDPETYSLLTEKELKKIWSRTEKEEENHYWNESKIEKTARDFTTRKMKQSFRKERLILLLRKAEWEGRLAPGIHIPEKMSVEDVRAMKITPEFWEGMFGVPLDFKRAGRAMPVSKGKPVGLNKAPNYPDGLNANRIIDKNIKKM